MDAQHGVGTANHRAARRRRAWWHVTAAEATAHATITAVILWLVALVIAFAGSGYRSVFGPLKGADFIHFYTLGHIDRQNASALYDINALHELQVHLVPESDPEHYPTVYPPQATLLFRPLAGLSYGAAALTWAVVLIVGYAVCVWLAWKPFRASLPDVRLLVAAASAFPPFWYLVLHGQTTIVPLLGFCLAWRALEADRRFWAGAALGLLLLKPQFVLVLVPLALWCREWRMIAGAAVSVAIQVGATIAALGTSVLVNYFTVVPRLQQVREILEPRPEQLHSLSVITDRLPAPIGAVAWGAAVVWIVVTTVRVWRSPVTVSLRMGCLVLASTLVNPHVFVYDAAVLALPLIWCAAWIIGEPTIGRDVRAWFTVFVYVLYISLLAPTASLVPGAQVSVVCLVAAFVFLSRSAPLRPESTPRHRDV